MGPAAEAMETPNPAHELVFVIYSLLDLRPTEDESTAHKLTDTCILEGRSRDDGTQQDDDRADEHTPTTAPCINSGTDEGECNNTTDLVHGRDNTSPDTGIGAMEKGFELGVDEQAVEQTSVVTVHGPEKCISNGQNREMVCG
jgi:hypothetical protein